MSVCQGRGECFRQCICFCDVEPCTCAHARHQKVSGGEEFTSKFCHKVCQHNCKLAPCKNYTLCKQSRPQHLLDCYNGMCLDCAVYYGKLRYERRGDCPVCFEPKDLVESVCGKHNICLDCWKRWTDYSTGPTLCPICHQSIWNASTSK